MTEDEMVDLVQQALAAAIDGDTAQASAALDALGDGCTNTQMYGVCCAIAEAGRRILRKLYGSGAPSRPGDMWAIEELVPGAFHKDPADAFAARFLVAYANRDSSTCLALFETALTAGGTEYVDSVCALLTNVAGLARLALAEKRAGRLPS
jgi:hypothetical protein